VAFVAAAGLRGGVPIVFATFPVAAGLTGSVRLFDIVFFVVVASVALQGLMLRPMARRLDVISEPPPYRATSLDADALRAAGAELIELRATTLGIDGPTLVRDLPLPSGAVIAAIRRDGQVVLPRGTTPVEPDDALYLLREREGLETRGES
jgi:cell volume regulation protein A